MNRYGLEWREAESGSWTAGSYTIEQNGWHDTTKRMARWVLRYRDTLIHTSSPLVRSAVDDCKTQADRHRGISDPFKGANA